VVSLPSLDVLEAAINVSANGPSMRTKGAHTINPVSLPGPARSVSGLRERGGAAKYQMAT